jgi:hypothetical protein
MDCEGKRYEFVLKPPMKAIINMQRSWTRILEDIMEKLPGRCGVRVGDSQLRCVREKRALILRRFRAISQEVLF